MVVWETHCRVQSHHQLASLRNPMAKLTPLKMRGSLDTNKDKTCSSTEQQVGPPPGLSGITQPKGHLIWVFPKKEHGTATHRLDSARVTSLLWFIMNREQRNTVRTCEHAMRRTQWQKLICPHGMTSHFVLLGFTQLLLYNMASLSCAINLRNIWKVTWFCKSTSHGFSQ